jgi:putative transposase
MEGLSLSVIGRRFGVSKEAVRQWMMKFEDVFSEKRLADTKERPAILLDETKVKRSGRIVYLSLCLDLERREVISTQCMSSITLVNTVGIVREALKTCSNERPVLIVDHAPWYLSASEWVKVDLLQKTFGIRNYIERWYRTFKERTRRFYNNFPIKDREKGIERISKFLHLFAFWYNHMRPHETFKGIAPSSLS